MYLFVLLLHLSCILFLSKGNDCCVDPQRNENHHSSERSQQVNEIQSLIFTQPNHPLHKPVRSRPGQKSRSLIRQLDMFVFLLELISPSSDFGSHETPAFAKKLAVRITVFHFPKVLQLANEPRVWSLDVGRDGLILRLLETVLRVGGFATSLSGQLDALLQHLPPLGLGAKCRIVFETSEICSGRSRLWCHVGVLVLRFINFFFFAVVNFARSSFERSEKRAMLYSLARRNRQ